METVLYVVLGIAALIVLAVLGMAATGAILGARDERRRADATDAMIDKAIEKGRND